MMSNDGLIIENMDLSHIHLAVNDEKFAKLQFLNAKIDQNHNKHNLLIIKLDSWNRIFKYKFGSF